MRNRILRLIRSAVNPNWSRQLAVIQSELKASKLQIGFLLHHSLDTQKEKPNLWEYGFSVWSQTDEDGILNFLVSRLKLSKPKCLEIGAGNFLESNFRFLAEVLNASVFAVDVREDLIKQVRAQAVSWLAPVIPHRTWVTPLNIQELVTRASLEIGGIDILSIDLDGNDYWVLAATDLENVKLVMVETNPLFGGIAPVSIPRDDEFSRFSAHHSGLYWGASIQAFLYLLEPKGFRLVGRNRKGFNAFFVRSEIVENDELLIKLSSQLDLSSDAWGIREGRDLDGKLSFNDPTALIRERPDLRLTDVVTSEQVQLGDIPQWETRGSKRLQPGSAQNSSSS